jgi:hypothetical protein
MMYDGARWLDIKLLSSNLVFISVCLYHPCFFSFIPNSHLSIATGLASRACRSDLAMGLRLRRAAATPTVATSNETMHRHRIEQLRQLQALPSILQAQTYEGPQDEDQLPSTHTSSSSTDVSSVVSFSDPLLAYTVKWCCIIYALSTFIMIVMFLHTQTFYFFILMLRLL